MPILRSDKDEIARFDVLLHQLDDVASVAVHHMHDLTKVEMRMTTGCCPAPNSHQGGVEGKPTCDLLVLKLVHIKKTILCVKRALVARGNVFQHLYIWDARCAPKFGMNGDFEMTATTADPLALSDFDRDGFVIFRNVLDADLMAEASNHVDWVQSKHPDLAGEDLGHALVARDPFWVRLISDDRLLDVAETFIGPNIALFASHYISKPPFSGKPVLWHQDAAYWNLEPMNAVTVWLAVDHSDAENGCLRVVPGSHKNEVEDLRDRHDIENVLGSEIAVEVDESLACDLVLAPGDVDVHHPNIIHGSKANHSPRRRCGLTIRYIPTSTLITGPEQPFASALHLRGEPGVNTYQPFPVVDEASGFPFVRTGTRWDSLS